MYLAAAGVGRELADRPGASLGLGFVAACVLPVASTLALVTIVPFPLGILGWTAFFVLLYVAQLFAAQAVGDAILKRARPEAVGSPYVSLAVGLVPLVLLVAVPWVGSLAWVLATLAGLGALTLRLRDRA